MGKNFKLNSFSPIGETSITIQKFLSQPARGRKSKYGVTVGDNNGTGTWVRF